MQRVALAELEHSTTRQWTSHEGAVLKVGTVGARWFAWHSSKGPAFVFTDERAMADLADRWLVRGRWHEVAPADGSR